MFQHEGLCCYSPSSKVLARFHQDEGEQTGARTAAVVIRRPTRTPVDNCEAHEFNDSFALRNAANHCTLPAACIPCKLNVAAEERFGQKKVSFL